MKHEWERHPDSESIRLPMRLVRVCQRCGAAQEKSQDHEWGRVVRTYWYPPVGRCHDKATRRQVAQRMRLPIFLGPISCR